MSICKTWLFGVIAASMVLSVLYALVPKGAMLTIARCTGGLVMLLVVVRPLLALDPAALHIRYEQWEEVIRQQIDTYSADNRQEMEAIIQRETAAYISEKALALGLTCHPEVTCTLRDGVPFPVEVTLDIPRNAELSRILAADLDIGEEAQHWTAAE